MSKQYRWSQGRVGRLIRMKVVGHRTYAQISKALGCTTGQAYKAYRRHYLSI